MEGHGPVQKIKIHYDPSTFTDVISEAGWQTHQKLYSGYIKKFNDGEHTPFIEGGYKLHELYFEQFMNPRDHNVPGDAVSRFIDDNFGSFSKFKETFIDIAKSFTGSGWVYLSTNGTINTITDHYPVSDVALIIDVWEHAYVETHGGNREQYLKRIWKIIDWNKIALRIGNLTALEEMVLFRDILKS